MRTSLRIGILGGGQLALLLALAAKQEGVPFSVFSENNEDPVAHLPGWNRGSLKSWVDLSLFFRTVDRVIFESEFLDTEVLWRAAVSAGRNPDTFFFPKLRVISKLQDKWIQKQIFEMAGVRLPPAWLGLPEIHSKSPHGGWVAKWSRQGYDGKGVWIQEPGTTLSSQEAAKFDQFVDRGRSFGGVIYTEKFVPYVRELALVVCRSGKRFWFYPLVVSEQREGICYRISGPASRLGITRETEDRIQTWAKVIGQLTEIEGVFALELFQTASGEVFVNEMAPRVHNSGHFSLDASVKSQFQLHVLAAAHLLDEVDGAEGVPSAPGFVMLNLLGRRGMKNARFILPEAGTLKGTQAKHTDYLKQEVRPGRKMGHITVWWSEQSTDEKMGKKGEAEAYLGLCEKEWVNQLQE